MCPLFYVLFSFEFLMFRIPLCFPFGKFLLAFFALVESKDVRHETAGNDFNLVLGDVSVIDELFPSTQVLSSA